MNWHVILLSCALNAPVCDQDNNLSMVQVTGGYYTDLDRCILETWAFLQVAPAPPGGRIICVPGPGGDDL